MITADRMAVAVAIREARVRAGYTQEQAAALRGHATSTISRWEAGSAPKTWDELIRYAHDLKQPIVLRFGSHEEAAPRVEERLDEIAAYVKAIAAVTPNVDLAEVEATVRGIQNLLGDTEPSRPPRPHGVQRRTDGAHTRGRAGG